jgi:hypothetical protein
MAHAISRGANGRRYDVAAYAELAGKEHSLMGDTVTPRPRMSDRRRPYRRQT